MRWANLLKRPKVSGPRQRFVVALRQRHCRTSPQFLRFNSFGIAIRTNEFAISNWNQFNSRTCDFLIFIKLFESLCKMYVKCEIDKRAKRSCVSVRFNEINCNIF